MHVQKTKSVKRTAHSVQNTQHLNAQRCTLDAQRQSREAGLTLIEAIVWLGVFTFIIGAIVVSLSASYRGQRFAQDQADATRNARAGIERIVQDVREASDADDGAYPVVSLATSSITFYSDYDNDQKVERVRYALEGDTLVRGTIESAGDPPTYTVSSEVVTVVSRNVRNSAVGTPLFTYFDRNGAAMTDLTDIDELSFVLVRLVIRTQAEGGPSDLELRSSATLRNVQ